MSPLARAQILRANRSLAAAGRLIANGDHDFAVSRAYYAMFHAATAMLLGIGEARSSHSALVAAFGQHFVKTGRIAAEHHQALRQALDVRHRADYDCSIEIPGSVAEKVLTAATRFVRVAEEHLAARG